MKEKFINSFNRNPLPFILILGLIVRLIAAFFSKGFITLDDHFNFVVDADTIANGDSLPIDYKDSPLYPYFGALIMKVARLLGNTSPDIEMLSIRLIQGLLSVLVIYYVYKILETKSDKTSAILGGLMTAMLFIIPIMAVHQFEEAICQIPLLASIWIITKQENEDTPSSLSTISAGILMGISLILRLPMISFVGVFLLGMLFQQSTRRYFSAFVIGVLFIVLAQAITNIFLNGEFGYSYYRNFGWIFKNPNDLFYTSGYPAGPVWRYFLTLFVIFIPPFSLLFLTSTFLCGKNFRLMGLSTLSFFIAHSIIANKQERFLLPIIPLLIILGVAGIQKVKIYFNQRGWAKIIRWNWIYFWILNSIILLFTLFHYGKKDRVEPFVYIQEQHDATGIAVSQFNYEFLVPDYYLGKPCPPIHRFLDKSKFNEEFNQMKDSDQHVNYVVLYGDSIAADKKLFEDVIGKPLRLEKEISPSLGDWIAHLFNPKYNRIKKAFVYSCR